MQCKKLGSTELMMEERRGDKKFGILYDIDYSQWLSPIMVTFKLYSVYNMKSILWWTAVELLKTVLKIILSMLNFLDNILLIN